MKILIVDNDINTVETLKAALSTKENYKIDIAYNGNKALTKMRVGAPYDLLILDIMMPKISGIDVCRLMIEDKRLKIIPVLLISALPVASKAFQESIEEFDELSVVKDVLEKPFSVDELVAKVETIVGKKQSPYLPPSSRA